LTNSDTTGEEQKPITERLEKRLEMFDQRLDNIDSVVSALVERVMKQPISLYVTCSKCGHKMEITLIGTEKPKK